MSGIWNAITGFFADALGFLHSGFDAVGFGDASWGWAIIALTLITRIAMLPLNIKQTRSMRHMQEIAPKVKEIQKKYKTDREMMRSNPEKYRMLKQKANEETMALYKAEGVNPAGGCLPLVAQMPIFLALFSILRSQDNLELVSAPFYFFTSEVGQVMVGDSSVPGGLGSATSSAGWPGWLLILLMGATMFITQRQMMARNTAADDAQAQQQKILMYVMPVFLAFVSFNLPLGVLLYWVTTNLWQMIQQYIMFRDLQAQKAKADGDDGPPAKPSNRGKGTGKAALQDAATKEPSKKPAKQPRSDRDDKGAGTRPGKGRGDTGRAETNGRTPADDVPEDEAPITTSPVHNPPGSRRKRRKRHLPGS